MIRGGESAPAKTACFYSENKGPKTKVSEKDPNMLGKQVVLACDPAECLTEVSVSNISNRPRCGFLVPVCDLGLGRPGFGSQQAKTITCLDLPEKVIEGINWGDVQLNSGKGSINVNNK